jgi:hypothetical protein
MAINLKRVFSAALWIALGALALLGWAFYDIYQLMWGGL